MNKRELEDIESKSKKQGIKVALYLIFIFGLISILVFISILLRIYDIFLISLMLMLSIIILIIGIVSLTKIGNFYQKLREQTSEKNIKIMGLVFIIYGSLLTIITAFLFLFI